MLRIANPAEKELSISVPEAKIAEFRSAGANGAAQKELRVATWSQPEKYYPAKGTRSGRLSRSDHSHIYIIRISLQKTDDDVQLGMSAFAVFIGANDADDARGTAYRRYTSKASTTGVWQIAADGKVSLKPVTVVQYKENLALIKGSVKPGDTIVAAGVHKLQEGEVVKPISDPQVTGDGKVAYAPVEMPPVQAKARASFFGN